MMSQKNAASASSLVSQVNTLPAEVLMDNPAYTDIIIPASPPPSYQEASACPPQRTQVPSTPPPAYTPGGLPPSYRETGNGVTHQEVHASPVVVVTQPTSALGDCPMATVCPHCHRQVTTSVTHKAGMAAWSMCMLLTLLGLICGFCLIPFMIDGCKDVHHSCPQCHRHLGIYVRK
ncbi:lipopolysaccharide-induced tumor necrosis factor-alpha factor homolog isoform X2 [Engraulis encrasicolus]|uniref:lipopolysaccharide-induced tumor necrosis factor-alpha factor homolog isoform X2 n=1 Tax=Engraulis encrasicolus TaxID=184585 RepID=UPI002FD1B95B